MREALKKARRAKGYSVADVARMVDISASFYYKMEKGVRDPIMEKAKRIADLLDGTVDELFFVKALDKKSKRMTRRAVS